MKKTKTTEPLGSAVGMLRHLLHENEHGAWSVKIDENAYYPLPRWLWAFCKSAMADARRAARGRRRGNAT